MEGYFALRSVIEYIAIDAKLLMSDVYYLIPILGPKN